MGLWECVAGLGAALLVGLWIAGLSVVLAVVALREVFWVMDFVHWANLLLGWPWPTLHFPALLLLDYGAPQAALCLLLTCSCLLYCLLKGLGLHSPLSWLESQIDFMFDVLFNGRSSYKPMRNLTAYFLSGGLLDLYWVWEPEAVERLEALAAGPLSGPPPLLDPATDNSLCVVLHALRRIAEANKSFADLLRGPYIVPLPWLEAMRPGEWGEESGQLGELLPGLQAALLQRPSPASPRLRALLIGLSADLSANRARPSDYQTSEEARRLVQTALYMACDEDEDADVAAAAWEAVLQLSGRQEQISYGLKVLCQNPQRPLSRIGKIIDQHANWGFGVPASRWFEMPEGEVRAPLLGLATQARLGVCWAAKELRRVFFILPSLSQEMREAFRNVGGLGILVLPLLQALRHGLPAVNQGLAAHCRNVIFLVLGYGVPDAGDFDEDSVTRCLRLLLDFLRSSTTGPVERTVAVGEWVGAGLVPLLRGLAAADGRPELASTARALLSLLVGPPQLLPSALLITSQAQAEDDAFFARCRRPRVPRSL